jgi:hypothetical protein
LLTCRATSYAAIIRFSLNFLEAGQQLLEISGFSISQWIFLTRDLGCECTPNDHRAEKGVACAAG